MLARAAQPAPRRTRRRSPRRTPPPLELVALGHERDGDQLTVRGVVRNPAGGAAMDRLTAVVLLFNRDGGFLASGRAAIDAPALGPAARSTFVVTVPGAATSARYRVSFRTDDRVVRTSIVATGVMTSSTP